MTETTKKPVRYMDFVGGRRASSTDPLISRPVAKRVVKKTTVSRPAPSSKSVSRPVARPAIKSTTNPPMKSASTVRKPAEPKILYSKKPILEEKATKAKLEALKSPKPAPKSVPITGRPKDDLALKASAALSGSKKSLDSPDNNAYSLGGKSPFLENYKIDKRPLSNSVPEDGKKNFEKISYLGTIDEPEEEATPKKNVYEKKEPSKKKKKTGHTVRVIDGDKKKSGIPLVVVIILTILLGAAVGAGIYFILPK